MQICLSFFLITWLLCFQSFPNILREFSVGIAKIFLLVSETTSVDTEDVTEVATQGGVGESEVNAV